jgi:CBS domain containing-hemolysin-like protein
MILFFKQRRHLLLVTLLLANAICMEALPICLDHISSPVPAIIISVSAVLMFGEIIPQAICRRYGLAIGSSVRWYSNTIPVI